MRGKLLAAALVVSAQFGMAIAAGPYDGTWTGGSPPIGRACPASTAEITVANGVMSGTYTTSGYSTGAMTFHMKARVAPDGSVKGVWGNLPFTGKFEGTHFEGSYDSAECKHTRPVRLDKKG